MTWYLDAGLAGAAFGLVTGAFLPEMIRPLPEPEPDPEEDKLFSIEEPKELYADIARLRWLRPVGALASAVAAFLVAARLDFSWELLPLLLFVPVGVALFVIDARTKYLPTWLLGPFYGVAVVVGIVAALDSGSWAPIHGMLAGWLVYGGFFTLMWLLVPAGGLGFGDVRLAGVLGLMLGVAGQPPDLSLSGVFGFVYGHIGWGPYVVGMFAGVLIAGVTAVLLVLVRRRKHYPYGPYLLVGALLGAMYGNAFADWYLGG